MSCAHDELLASLDFDRLDLPSKTLDQARSSVLDLTGPHTADDQSNLDEYDGDQSIEVYRNFLDWLFATFKTSEAGFRAECIAELNLKPGQRVLVTSCGLGEDVAVCLDQVGEAGWVHAQDLSRQFVVHAQSRLQSDRVVFTLSNALDLPYKDDYFDAVYHFGGINLFGDIAKAVSEMNRVCRAGGRVVFGDESVAPHLRAHDYGQMFTTNNSLWAAELPLRHLPLGARDISLRYILGNCFYLIGFEKGETLPDVDIDVPHIGHRGGSVRTRYFGALEGVSESARNKIHAYARAQGVSVSKALERLINTL